jgi:hypothetical protein
MRRSEPHFYGAVVGQPEAGGPSTVTLMVPVIKFPVGLLVNRPAVILDTPQFVFGLTLPLLLTCAT